MEHENESNRVEEIVHGYGAEKRFSLAIMQDIQREFNYIPKNSLQIIADYLQIPPSTLYGMATFYKALSLNPKGRFTIKVCDGTACHIRGAAPLLDALERKLGIKPGETTEDGLFTVETVNCLGACAIAPVMLVGEEYYGGLTPEKLDAVLDGYRKEAGL